MNKRNRVYSVYSMLLLFLFSVVGNVYADTLPLSNTQIQKLQSLFSNSSSETSETSHLIWNGDSLSVDLPLNQEKRLVFPDHVTVDVKGQLTTDQLRVINNDRSLYFTALKAFATTRIYITLQSSGEVILMDIATNDKATNQTETIDVMQDNNDGSKPSSNHVVTTASWINPSESTSEGTSGGISNNERNIHLIRYAWQQLFAPESMIPIDSNIMRVPMHAPFFLSHLIYGDKVLANPLGEWEDNTIYVTALALRNKYPHVAQIHIPQDLCGNWQSATLYPKTFLKPAGTRNGDSATLFLISNQPFMQSYGVCDGTE